MNPLTLLGDSLKALASPPRLTYAPQSSSGYTTSASNFGFWPGSASPGAKRDYTTLVGDPLQNYVIAAAVNAISLALPDAPPFLENLQDGTWKRVDDHPVLDFLRQPHEDLDDADVWSLTSVYRVTRGEAFWVIQLNNLGLPAEAVPTDPRRVRVIGTREQLISGYEVTTEEGHALLFPKEQIIHFRHLPAPHNLRRGWPPLSTGNRQLVGSNSASTYHTALLLNGAVSSWLISMKDATQGTVSPEQFQTFIDAMRRKYANTTESAGGIDGLSIPLEIQRMAYSPDEMAIDKLIDYYEQTLCALTGVSKKLLDLGSDATYLNLREAINDFWERRLVPMRNKDARALTNQLLPLFGLEKTQWRVRFDYSNVPALQENQDQLFTRWRDLYKAGGIDLYTLQTKIGLPDVPPTYKEHFFGQKPQEKQQEGSLEAKAVWTESEHPRDKHGRFGNGNSTSRNSQSYLTDPRTIQPSKDNKPTLKEKAEAELQGLRKTLSTQLPTKSLLNEEEPLRFLQPLEMGEANARLTLSGTIELADDLGDKDVVRAEALLREVIHSHTTGFNRTNLADPIARNMEEGLNETLGRLLRSQIHKELGQDFTEQDYAERDTPGGVPHPFEKYVAAWDEIRQKRGVADTDAAKLEFFKSILATDMGQRINHVKEHLGLPAFLEYRKKFQ